MAVDERPSKDLRASIPIEKPIVYIDMDGVLCDFDKRHLELMSRGFSKSEAFDHPEAYANLEPLSGAVEAYHELCKHFEVYILSTASWDNLDSWKEKRIWVEEHLGPSIHKKLILSHNKGLLIGDYLIDDRIANGVSDFPGTHIHFGSEKFPDWKAVVEFLVGKRILYKDPFLGPITLTQRGETSRHAMGESVVDTIYTDDKGNFYIQTWSTTNFSGDIPMSFLRKELVEKLTSIYEQLRQTVPISFKRHTGERAR